MTEILYGSGGKTTAEKNSLRQEASQRLADLAFAAAATYMAHMQKLEVNSKDAEAIVLKAFDKRSTLMDFVSRVMNTSPEFRRDYENTFICIIRILGSK